MLGIIANVTGGIVKDTVVGVKKLSAIVLDEIASIPEAFSEGYDKGIITSDNDVEYGNTIQQMIKKKFGEA